MGRHPHASEQDMIFIVPRHRRHSLTLALSHLAMPWLVLHCRLHTTEHAYAVHPNDLYSSAVHSFQDAAATLQGKGLTVSHRVIHSLCQVLRLCLIKSCQ